LPADFSHELALAALRRPWLGRALGTPAIDDSRLSIELAGMKLRNPVGLAAGFDKNCEALSSLMRLGFGFLSPGAIMRDVRTGNPKPRLGRYAQRRALINSMGLPSKGREQAIRNLRRLTDHRLPVFANLQGISPDEIIDNLLAIQPHVDAVELALVCPNTRDTEVNQDLSTIMALIRQAAAVKTRPIFAKVPDTIYAERREELPAFVEACASAGLDGIVASGTQRRRTRKLSMGYGQLSGPPVFPHSLALVRDISEIAAGRLLIIGVGGIETGRDAYAMLKAGASAIEILTAFVYRGWRAPELICQELLQVLDEEGFESVSAFLAQRDSGNQVGTHEGDTIPSPS
jgi:dihydroorotate dehydrogenase